MVSEADGEAEERDDTRELTASSPTCTSVKSTTTRRATASMIYQGTAGTVRVRLGLDLIKISNQICKPLHQVQDGVTDLSCGLSLTFCFEAAFSSRAPKPWQPTKYT